GGSAGEAALCPGEPEFALRRPGAGLQSPLVPPVPGPRQRMGVGISAWGVGCPPRVLEIVEARLAHGHVAYAAEIDPDVAVLVAEQLREGEVGLAVFRAHEALVVAAPFLPRIRRHRMGRRAEAEEVNEHR